MFPGESIEAGERRARDDMIRRGELPMGNAATETALAAMGIRRNGFLLSLPPRWRMEADPLDHRRWFVLDQRGIRRAAAFWKEIDYESRGSCAIVEDQRLVRQWEGEDSEYFSRTRNFRLTLACGRCDSPDGYGLSISAAMALEHPAGTRHFVEQHERAFLAKHICGS